MLLRLDEKTPRHQSELMGEWNVREEKQRWNITVRSISDSMLSHEIPIRPHHLGSMLPRQLEDTTD
jgi:hypothetical protein